MPEETSASPTEAGQATIVLSAEAEVVRAAQPAETEEGQ